MLKYAELSLIPLVRNTKHSRFFLTTNLPCDFDKKQHYFHLKKGRNIKIAVCKFLTPFPLYLNLIVHILQALTLSRLSYHL